MCMLHAAGGTRECQANNVLENSIRPTALGKNYLVILISARVFGINANARLPCRNSESSQNQVT
jgi:hypothetical protein